MKAFDCGFLSLVFHGHLNPSGRDLQVDIDKAHRLVGQLQRSHERVLVPMPALSELLVRISDPETFLARLKTEHFYKIADFDEIGAIELAAVARKFGLMGKKRGSASPRTPWQKVKLDRQIVAISKVHKADTIYTCDKQVPNIAKDFGIDAKLPGELFCAPATHRPRFPRDVF